MKVLSILSGGVNFIAAAFIIFTGIYFAIKTDVLKKLSFSSVKKELFSGGVSRSSFRAFTASLGGTVGVGNIIGVSSAIAIGGAGSIFWMCLSAIACMWIKYVEVFNACSVQKKSSSSAFSYAPMDLLKLCGKHGKRLASTFALLGLLVSLLMGAMTQSGAVVDSLAGFFPESPIPCWVYGLCFCGLVLFFSVGGNGRLLSAVEVMIPGMCIIYVVGCFIVIGMNVTQLPAAFAEIISSAFSFKAGAGGFLGMGIVVAIGQGTAKGIFSNEAGLGTAPLAHGISYDSTPVREGIWGSMEVFIDTVIISGLTGIAIVCGGYGNAGRNAVLYLFTDSFGGVGGCFVWVSLVVFGLTSVLTWEYYCKCFFAYIYGSRRAISLTATALFIIALFLGGVIERDAVWMIVEILNGGMAFINVSGNLIFSSKKSSGKGLGKTLIYK